MRPYLAILVLSVVLAQAGPALGLSSNWFFSVQEGGLRCVDVMLPDDSGYAGLGTHEYVIRCEPTEECISWGTTVTEETVTASENNTGIIPVCFIVPPGRPVGNCSYPMTISVESLELGISQSWEGGICVSRYEDFDSSARAEGQDVEDVLSDNFDLFDMGFSQPRLFLEPGGNATYRLLLESYAGTELDLELDPGGLEASPLSTAVSLSGESPTSHVDYSISAAEEGTYQLTVSARARGCQESYCYKSAAGTVVVIAGAEEPGEGFSLSMFPQSINVKDLEPVAFRFSIKNFGERSVFEPSLTISPVASSTFSEEGIDLEDGEEAEKGFIVRPSNASALYEITLSVRSGGGDTKRVTSYLSTNEMLTDIIREKDGIKDPEKLGEVSGELDQWYQDYRGSDYGSDLEGYSSLKDALSAAGANATENRNDDLPPPETIIVPEAEPGPGLVWLVPVVMAAIVILAFFLWSRKGKPSREQDNDIFGRG